MLLLHNRRSLTAVITSNLRERRTQIMSNIMISKDTNMTTNEALVLRSFREMKTLKAIAVATALRSSQACSKLRMTKDS